MPTLFREQKWNDLDRDTQKHLVKMIGAKTWYSSSTANMQSNDSLYFNNLIKEWSQMEIELNENLLSTGHGSLESKK